MNYFQSSKIFRPIKDRASRFDALSEKMNEITAKRKQFEQNLQKTSKRKAFEIEDDSQVEITKKVDQAIDEAIRNYEKPTREKIVRKSKSVEKVTKLAPKSSRTFRRATADRLAKSKG